MMDEGIRVFCVGLIGLDMIGRTQLPMQEGDDLPGVIETSIGGVIANIAVALTSNNQIRSNLSVILLSSTGNDQNSEILLSSLTRNQVNCDYIVRENGLPDGYIAIEVDGELFGAISSGSQLEKSCIKILKPLSDGLLLNTDMPFTDYIILDTNLTAKTIDYLSFNPLFRNNRFVISCASPFKAQRIHSILIERKCIIYANLAEASKIADKSFTCSADAAEYIFNLGAQQAIITNGKNQISSMSSTGLVSHVPEATKPSRVTGAGDTFLAAHFLSSIVNKNYSEKTHLEIADSFARQTISNVLKGINV